MFKTKIQKNAREGPRVQRLLFVLVSSDWEDNRQHYLWIYLRGEFLIVLDRPKDEAILRKDES